MQTEHYKIGEVADLLATSIRTIRYYEEEGLLTPIRTPRGTRLYSNIHLARLKMILRLTSHGFSIEAIRQIAEIRETGQTGAQSSIQVDQHLEDIQMTIAAQIDALENIQTEINDARSVISGCNQCSNKPSTKGCPDCPVRKNLTEIELLNLIWDTE